MEAQPKPYSPAGRAAAVVTVRRAVTPGEQLEVTRRRNRLTQTDAAAACGVSRAVWCKWETDRLGDGLALPMREFDITEAEWCFVQRRRSGMRLRDLSELTGLAMTWLHRAERGELHSVEPLTEWWKAWRAGQ